MPPPFLTRRQALDRGITDAQLRGPLFRRLFTNLYVPSGLEVTPRVLSLGALTLAPPGAVVARHTASLLLGGTVPGSAATHLALPTGRLRVAGIDARRGDVRGTVQAAGVPVTSAEETFVAMAGELGLVDLVILGDSLVAKGRTSPADLVAAAAVARGRCAAPARRAASLVRAGVDSPMETRLRLLIVLAGLPEPVVNHVMYDEWGRWVRRFDLAYPELRVAVEYDGRQHAEDRGQWESDVARREAGPLSPVLAGALTAMPATTPQIVAGPGRPTAIRDTRARIALGGAEWRGRAVAGQGAAVRGSAARATRRPTRRPGSRRWRGRSSAP